MNLLSIQMVSFKSSNSGHDLEVSDGRHFQWLVLITHLEISGIDDLPSDDLSLPPAYIAERRKLW